MDRVRLFLVACGLALSACQSATNPSDPRNQIFTLAPGQFAVTEVAAIHIQFVSVPSDSRCPTDVNCLVAGDATVRLQVQSPASPVQTYELHTGKPEPVTHAGATISLVELMPLTVSTRTIQPGDYRATVQVVE